MTQWPSPWRNKNTSIIRIVYRTGINHSSASLATHKAGPSQADLAFDPTDYAHRVVQDHADAGDDVHSHIAFLHVGIGTLTKQIHHQVPHDVRQHAMVGDLIDGDDVDLTSSCGFAETSGWHQKA